jgi:hypothetical protein
VALFATFINLPCPKKLQGMTNNVSFTIGVDDTKRAI